MLKNSTKIYLSIGFIVSVIFLVYSPGLNGKFQFDDYPNIVENQRLHLQSLSFEEITKATLSGNSGSFVQRPISMLSFALNYYFSKLSPFSYKLTNLIIHIINSLGIYWLSLLLLRQIKITHLFLPPFFIALAWAVHPINLTSVLYVVQRMTSLSASFVILGMILYLNAKNNLHHQNFTKGFIGLIAVFFLALCSILAKENGALLFVFLLLIELIFFRDFFSSNTKIQITSILFFTVALLLPSIYISGYILLNPDWITNGYINREFTLTERLLTEFRVIWLYIFWILLPNNQSLGLFHDDIEISHSLFDDTLPILAGSAHLLFIGLLIFLWIKNKQPLFVFGCLFYYCSQLIESTIFSLEIAHEHRNYLGSFGLLLAAFSLLLNFEKKNTRIFQICIVFYIAFLAFLTTQRANDWGNGLEGALIEVAHHQKSAAAHYEAGRQYAASNTIENQKKAIDHFNSAAELGNTKADSLFAILSIKSRNNWPVSPDLLKNLKYRLSHGPAYASHASWLSSIISCYSKAICKIEESEIADIARAALSNENLHKNPLTESFTLMTTAGFLASGGHNYKNALELSIIAANSSPGNVIFIRNIIELAIAFKDFETAREWIKIFEAQPYAYFSSREIQLLKNKLPTVKL